MCRAKRGEKVFSSISGYKYHRINIVAGLHCGQIIAPMEYCGSTDHIVFETWFEHVLLRELPAGSTIVMDNASFHRKDALNKLARYANCTIAFLPPYSPDYNPIEKKWANMKAFWRSYTAKYENI
jgi:transposase